MHSKSNAVPAAMKEKYDEINEIIQAFCKENLNDEYADMCKKLCAALCRKRPSPLLKGRSRSWACGIVHAIGTVNFLFDPSQNPHMKASELYAKFGVSENTGGGKSKEIRDKMDIVQFEPEWTLPSKIDDNPLVWLIMVDGSAMDARNAPRHIQEAAFRQGIIPYIPGDGDKNHPAPEAKVIELGSAPTKKSKKAPKRSAIKKAQDLVNAAWESGNRDEKIQLAQQALELWEDCADAYIILADTAENIETAKELMETAVKIAEKAIGEENFKAYVGHFWLIPETRSYMQAKRELINILWYLDEYDEAIGQMKEMLVLNPNDNQGVRYLLFNCLITVGNDTEVKKLLDMFPDEDSTNWHYSHALYLFCRGKRSEADKKLKQAFESNPYVPPYLIGDKQIPSTPPYFVGIGDETEAQYYAWDTISLWKSIDGARQWVKRNFKANTSAKPKP